MTVTILIDHDTIFYEVYLKARKLSLATVLGRKKALQTSLLFSVVAYAMVISMAILKMIPIWSISAPVLSALVLSRKARVFSKPNEPPPYYVPFTQNGLLADWLFFIVLAISLAI